MQGPLSSSLSATEPNTPYSQRYCGVVLFDKAGKAILQTRDKKSNIVNPGLTTLFGGGQHGDETPEACILRELDEELELKVQPESLQFLGYIDKQEANDHITRCSIFCAHNIDTSLLRLQEGHAITLMDAQDVFASSSVSDVTKIAVRAAIHIH